MADFNTI